MQSATAKMGARTLSERQQAASRARRSLFLYTRSVGAVTGESHFLEEQMNPVRIKQYLDAPRDYDKAKGMKWLLAMMSKGRDASEFFSDVVK
jgi:vesicle coat complex subunit